MITMPKEDLPIMYNNMITNETRLIHEMATLEHRMYKDDVPTLSSLKKRSSPSGPLTDSPSYKDSHKQQGRKRRLNSTNLRVQNYMLEKHLENLENLTREHGPSHAKVGKQLNAIGLYYQHVERDLDKAIEYHEMAMDIQRNTEDSVATLIDIAFIREQQGKFLLTAELFSEAKELLENVGTVQEHDHRLYAIRSGLARNKRNQN
mmetsp:Transcript_14562/g.20575  ORF Transcript_14562/g.20575 Transcript_14562/m.20575 type:complete len:205 (-) Transcript_14562:42-656(-)